jgi:hypothetical protein
MEGERGWMHFACRIASVLVLSVLLAGCGGAKRSYTYDFVSTSQSPLVKGVYLSVISPIKVPASAFKGGRLVDHVAGPEACSTTQVVKDPPKRYPQFKGRRLTFKVYGHTGFTAVICGLLRKSVVQAFSP